jgi:pyruvate dehydrogenase E2 component (dihydrolipoamide acetyltransferase)
MADITMPQLGETVTEGTITRWAKQVGDKVEEDEVLFEVSTDKVDSEVPSPSAGYVSEILVPEGETVEVGAKLAVITDQPPAGGSANGDKAATAPAEASTAPPEPAAKEEEPEPQKAEPGETADEVAARADADEGVSADEAPAPKQPEPEPEPRPSAGTRPPDGRPSSRPGDGAGKVLSPVVRRLLAEHDLDPDQIEGTGQGGRITRADVLDVIDKGAGQRTQAKAPAQPGQSPTPSKIPTPAPSTVKPGERDEVVPFSNIRRRTAEHMVRSLDTSAHTLVVVEVDYHAVDKVRKAEGDRFRAEEGIGLNYLPFISRAVIDAIRDFPHLNASVGEDELVVHHYVNLGVAVDLNFEGLIVPVVQGAEGKRLRAIAREIADLATRARAKKLTADDIAGGTFTLTNAGPFGTLLTAPIINQPQVAILATDGVRKRPVVVELPDGEDAIVIHPVGNLALSFDHRAFDGAYASAFLAKVRETLETRDWSQEL